MNPGPPTQPYLWDVLLRSILAPVCFVGVVEKAVVQVELDKSDWDPFRFICKSRNRLEKYYIFCRVPLGGENSPFLLGGVVKYHLETQEGDESVKKSLKENTYVDNVMGLVSTKEEAKNLKGEATEIMSKGKFLLGKWESIIKALNDEKARVKD